MRRHVPGLCSGQQDVESTLDGLFLVKVDKVCYRWHPCKPFIELRFTILEPKEFDTQSFLGRLYCTDKALWKLNWLLRDFGYDTDLLKGEQVDDQALKNLRGVIRTSNTTVNGRSYQNLDAFAPAGEWKALSYLSADAATAQGDSDAL